MMEQAPDEELLVDATNTSACQEIPEIKKTPPIRAQRTI